MLQAVQDWIEGPRTYFVSMPSQFFHDAEAEDRALNRMMQDVHPDQSRVEVLRGHGALSCGEGVVRCGVIDPQAERLRSMPLSRPQTAITTSVIELHYRKSIARGSLMQFTSTGSVVRKCQAAKGSAQL